MLAATAFLETHGIIHTDIKPDNIGILSASSRSIKLMDMGSTVFSRDLRNSYMQTRW